MRMIRKPRPSEGDTRAITRFLFFPMSLCGETRWLETATYTEEYKRAYSYDGLFDFEWTPVYWETPKCRHGYTDWDECPDCGH